MKLDLDPSFFTTQGPPSSSEEIYATGSFLRVKGLLALGEYHKTGDIRIIVGRRGSGKSTSLAYLLSQMNDGRRDSAAIFDAGQILTKMLSAGKHEAVDLFFKEVALAVSNRKTDDINEVGRRLRDQDEIFVLFIDNLDRLHKDKSDLDFVEYFFQVADPIFKELSKKCVVVITAAPEWAAVLSKNDLSYLNYRNHVELKPLEYDELAGLLEARLHPYGLQSTKLFDSGFVHALHVAGNGHPRNCLQILETINRIGDFDSLPATTVDFHRIVPNELFAGSLQSLRDLAEKSSKISWGVNNLAKFFGNLEKSQIDSPQAIALFLRCFEKQHLDQQVLSPPWVWVTVAHREGHENRWVLHDQVREVLSHWGKATGIPRELLLTAFSQEPFTTSTTDVPQYAADLQQALSGFPRELRDLEKGLQYYYELATHPRTEWEPSKLVEAAWKANESLMLAVLTVFYGENQDELRKDLSNASTFGGAATRVIEGITQVLAAIERQNPYRVDLLQIKEMRLELGANPAITLQWRDYQLDHVLKAAANAYEGLLRLLKPARLKDIANRDADRLLNYVRQGESQNLEFKETLQWDVRRSQKSEDVLHSTLKTIAGFMNSSGGTLIIGVDSRYATVGIWPDCATLRDHNHDGFERALFDAIDSSIGKLACASVRVDFLSVDSHEVCRVRVQPGQTPAYVTAGHKASLYIRTGNSTRELAGPEASDYLRHRFERKR